MISKKLVRTKSQTIVGKQQYINSQTGEIQNFTVITKNIPADFNFHKIWLQDILNVLDSFGNKKIAVLKKKKKNMRNEDNTVSGSLRELATICKVSYPTACLVIKELTKNNILKRIRSGTYQFNPDLIVKGSSGKRERLLIEYNFEASDKIYNRSQEVKPLMNQ